MSTITPTSAGTATSGSGSASTGTLTSAADQQDRFMKLLVAQMKNQDPLNPMDNAQMTSQIAQINTVGGIEKLNATVQSLLTAFGAMQAQSAADLAGRKVLVDGSALTLQGGSAAGGVQVGGAADSVKVDIVDAGGSVVRSLSLGASSEAGVRSFTWDGKANDGSAVPDGSYRVRASASQAGKSVTATPLVGASVQSVNTPSDGSGARIDLGTLGTVPTTAIRSYL